MAIALVHFAAGRYSECVTWARNLIEKSPGYPAGHMYLIAALAGQRRRFPAKPFVFFDPPSTKSEVTAFASKGTLVDSLYRSSYDSSLEGDEFELSVPRYKRCFLTLPIRWLGAPGDRFEKLRRDGISAIPLWQS